MIEHRPGKNMAHVDALNRSPLPTCLIVSECERGLLARLKRAQRADADLGECLRRSAGSVGGLFNPRRSAVQGGW